MKKSISILAVMLAVVLAFASCGQSEPRSLLMISGGEYGNAAKTEADTLKIMQFNVKNCALGEQIDGIADEIRGQSPDVVFLQELDWNVPRSGKKEVLRLLAEKLKMHYAFFSSIPLDGGDYGLGILSAYPISDTENEALPTRAKDEGRILARAEISAGGETIQLFNTHLSFESKDKRLEQLDFISERLSAEEKFILCGDFNIEGYDELEHLQNVTLVNNSEKGYQTYAGDDEPSEFFRGIDNIVLPQGFKLLNSEVVKTAISDHHMLTAEIEL